MYGVVSGTVRVELSTPDHGPYFVHLLRSGTWVGEGPAIIGQSRPATLTATRPAAVLSLPRSAVQEVTLLDPTYWRFFVVPLMGHLDVALGTIADQLVRDHHKRLAAVLLRLGGCRAETPVPFVPVEIDASQEDLATMVNIGRNTAGALLRRWEAAKMIQQTYGQITLLAPDRLRSMLSE